MTIPTYLSPKLILGIRTVGLSAIRAHKAR